MLSNILKLFKTNYGKNIISIILGLGLSSLFRNICKEKNCINFYGPNMDEIKNNTYKYNNKCYKFTPTTVKCNINKTLINFKQNKIL
jgi:hypothetical protein